MLSIVTLQTSLVVVLVESVTSRPMQKIPSSRDIFHVNEQLLAVCVVESGSLQYSALERSRFSTMGTASPGISAPSVASSIIGVKSSISSISFAPEDPIWSIR